MIKYTNNGILIQTLAELPNLKGSKDVYLDFETTSGDSSITSLNPWFNCKILGACITTDEHEKAWYIPLRHETGNLPCSAVYYWLDEILVCCDQWVNHNIKYDANVWLNNISNHIHCKLVDTLTLAKIIDSDRFRYSLENLSKDWLEDDISRYADALKPYLYRNKDYGKIPADIMAEYGSQDVLTARRLYKYCVRRCPEQCKRVWETEILYTPVLLDMEQRGLTVEPQELKIENLRSLSTMLSIEEEIHNKTKLSIRPHTNADCFDLLCNQYGLPILGYTEKGEPSFDKDTLQQYLLYPNAPVDLVELLLKYRKLHTLNSLFIEKWIPLEIDGLLHSTYNQMVRTGRTSCSNPNAQQLNLEAKKLIHPRKGYAFVSMDYSQIEFRLIVHYIRNAAAIRSYNKDPDTDFHQWMADMCVIPRKPAKNINFAVGYGAGKKKVISMLASNMELMESIERGEPRKFRRLCTEKAEEVYNTYHSTLPELKRTSYLAATKCRSRGHVFNAYGRQRRLPVQVAYIAFNAIIQSSAADVMKDRAVAIAPRYDGHVRAWGWHPVAMVHDDFLWEAPLDNYDDPFILEYITDKLENPDIKFDVPIRIGCKSSTSNWAEVE